MSEDKHFNVRRNSQIVQVATVLDSLIGDLFHFISPPLGSMSRGEQRPDGSICFRGNSVGFSRNRPTYHYDPVNLVADSDGKVIDKTYVGKRVIGSAPGDTSREEGSHFMRYK